MKKLKKETQNERKIIKVGEKEEDSWTKKKEKRNIGINSWAEANNLSGRHSVKM